MSLTCEFESRYLHKEGKGIKFLSPLLVKIHRTCKALAKDEALGISPIQSIG